MNAAIGMPWLGVIDSEMPPCYNDRNSRMKGDVMYDQPEKFGDFVLKTEYVRKA